MSWLALSGLWLCGVEPRARLSGSGGGVSGPGAGDICGGGTWPGAFSARPGAESASGSGSGSAVLSDRGKAWWYWISAGYVAALLFYTGAGAEHIVTEPRPAMRSQWHMQYICIIFLRNHYICIHCLSLHR